VREDFKTKLISLIENSDRVRLRLWCPNPTTPEFLRSRRNALQILKGIQELIMLTVSLDRDVYLTLVDFPVESSVFFPDAGRTFYFDETGAAIKFSNSQAWRDLPGEKYLSFFQLCSLIEFTFSDPGLLRKHGEMREDYFKRIYPEVSQKLKSLTGIREVPGVCASEKFLLLNEASPYFRDDMAFLQVHCPEIRFQCFTGALETLDENQEETTSRQSMLQQTEFFTDLSEQIAKLTQARLPDDPRAVFDLAFELLDTKENELPDLGEFLYLLAHSLRFVCLKGLSSSYRLEEGTWNIHIRTTASKDEVLVDFPYLGSPRVILMCNEEIPVRRRF
jgi:hypothetical protein